ncbi:MAG: carbonic anhydrase [Acidobacteriaceae bacterium]
MRDELTRRSVLKGACGVVAGAALNGAALSGVQGLSAVAATSHDDKAPQNAITPTVALHRLMDGNARYTRNQSVVKDYSAGRAARATAQYPVAAILGCADARVSPELVFDQGPGDLFVTRVAGNYMNTDNLASLEYAVELLHAPLVMVLGHTNCGAVSAVVKNAKKNEPLPGHIYLLVDAVQPGVAQAIKQGGDNVLVHAVEENVRHNVERLRRAQPLLTQHLAKKTIDVVGAVYDLDTGQVRLL